MTRKSDFKSKLWGNYLQYYLINIVVKSSEFHIFATLGSGEVGDQQEADTHRSPWSRCPRRCEFWVLPHTRRGGGRRGRRWGGCSLWLADLWQMTVQAVLRSHLYRAAASALSQLYKLSHLTSHTSPKLTGRYSQYWGQLSMYRSDMEVSVDLVYC